MPGAAAHNVSARARDAALKKLDKEILEACNEGRTRLMDQLLDQRLQIMEAEKERAEADAA